MLRSSLAFTLLTLAICACSNTGNSNMVPPLEEVQGAVCPQATVTVPSSPPLIAPANGSSNVSDATSVLYFQGAANSFATVQLTAQNGTILHGGVLMPTSGALPPSIAANGSQVSEATIPTLAPATTYVVSFGTVGACPQQYDGSAGQFSTQ